MKHKRGGLSTEATQLRRQWLTGRKKQKLSQRVAREILPMGAVTLSEFERGLRASDDTLEKVRSQLAKWETHPEPVRVKGKPGRKPGMNGLGVFAADLRSQVAALRVYLGADVPVDAKQRRLEAFEAWYDLCAPGALK